jgi:hypothetical protein
LHNQPLKSDAVRGSWQRATRLYPAGQPVQNALIGRINPSTDLSLLPGGMPPARALVRSDRERPVQPLLLAAPLLDAQLFQSERRHLVDDAYAERRPWTTRKSAFAPK